MTEETKVCLNCNHPITELDKFCPECGQNTKVHLLSFKELIANIWSSIFNLDNTVFKTIKYIWAPWKLTQYYVQGKQKSFLNPMRLFLITLLLHFGVFFSVIKPSENKLSNKIHAKHEKSKLLSTYIDHKKEIGNDSASVRLLDTMQLRVFGDALRPIEDTLNNFMLFDQKIKLSQQDLLETPLDSIYKRDGITKWHEKLVVKQMVAGYKDVDGMIGYILGNLIWVILLVIFCLAFVMKMIYYKTKKWYVEHLVFLLNVHSFSFLVNTISIYLASKFWGNGIEDPFLSIFFLFPTVISLISLYKYYQQGLLKTLLKYSFLGFFYVFFSAIFLTLISFISLFIF